MPVRLTCWWSCATFAGFVAVAVVWVTFDPLLGVIGAIAAGVVGCVLPRSITSDADGDLEVTYVVPRTRRLERDQIVGIKLSRWRWLTVIELASHESIVIPGYLTQLEARVDEAEP